MNRHLWKPLLAGVLAAIPCLVGCNGRQGPPKMPTPEVGVLTVQPQTVTLTSELPGRTAGYLVAEIRPQVNGLLQKRLFTEGADVKAGDVLYQIDPAPYQAAYHNAVANLTAARESADRAEATVQASKASLERHEAILELAKTNLRRYENLLKTNAASAMQRDQAAADVRVADSALKVAQAQIDSDQEAVNVALAAIQQAEAAVETARINLGYTKIIAPISGRIGRSAITEGAIVTAYQPMPLATIQKFDPIFVDVPQSTTEISRLKRRLASGQLKNIETDKVKIILEDGTEYAEEGSFKFRDVTVDPTTGSVILRIVVPNPDGILLPGMFVKARVQEGINDRAILVPQEAVSRDSKGNPMVMLVNAKGIVEPRPLATDRAVGDQWLVSSGLASGDRVIVRSHMMKTPPGTPVKAVPFGIEKTPAARSERTAQAPQR
ncbi:MAG: efflux RND transporter periplasmic adaptor subunit [Pirellulales bacterium]|nr:efflux RND transporter periplasmic adaptor subunit [Pirellulales bacterium]